MKKKGFTLIEMLIVIIIIGILAIALIPRIGGARNRANDTARIADVRSIATALIQYGLDYPTYPEGDEGESVNGTGYLTSGATHTSQKQTACSLYNVSALMDATYGLGGNLPTDPVSQYHYNYRLLDSRDDHFVICARLSDGSKQGNATSNLALVDTCPTHADKTSNVLDAKETYSGVLAALTKSGGYYCYVG